MHCFRNFGSVVLVHLLVEWLLPPQNKQLNLALSLPESKPDAENLPIVSCFSSKLKPELNDLSLLQVRF